MNVNPEQPADKPDSETSPKKGMSLTRLFLHDAFELLGILLLLAGALVFAAFFYVHHKAVSLNSFKHIIEQRLSNEEQGLKASIADLNIAWPDLKKPWVLQASSIELKRYDEPAFLSVSKATIELYLMDLITGQLALKSAIVEDPKITLYHQGKHRYKTSITDVQIATPKNPEKLDTKDPNTENNNEIIAETPPEITTAAANPISDFLSYFSHAPERLPAAYRRIQEIALFDADIKLVNVRSGESFTPQSTNFLIERKNNLIEAAFKLGLSEEYGETPMIDVKAGYDGLEDSGFVRLDFKEINLTELLYNWVDIHTLQNIKGLFSGSAETVFSTEDGLETLTFSLASDKALINEENKTLLTLSPFLIEGSLEDKEDDGSVLSLKKAILGEGREISKASIRFDPDPASLKINITIPKLEADFIDTVWPKPEDPANKLISYTWLVEKLNIGTYSNVNAAVELTGQLRDANNVKARNPLYPWSYNWNLPHDNITLDFDFDNLSVRYLDTLPQAEKASGHGHIENDSMTLDIKSATLNQDITLKEPTQFIFTDFLKVGGGHAKTTLPLTGPLPSILSYLSNEPISLQKYVDLNPETAKGMVDLTVGLSFPTVKDLKKEEIELDVNATLTNVTLPAVLDHLPLTDGPFTIKTDGRDFTLAGKGYLGGTPIELTWHQFLRAEKTDPYIRKIIAKTRASAPLQNIFNLNLSSFTADEIPVDVTHIKKTPSLSSLDVTANLTPVALSLGFLDYTKEKDMEATLKFDATLKDESITDISTLSLKGTGLYVEGKNLKFPEGANHILPNAGTLNPFDVGDTKAELQFKKGEGQNSVQMDIVANTLDAAGFINQEKGGFKGLLPALTIRAKANKLFLKNGEFFENTEFVFKQNAEGAIRNIQLQGLSGQKPVYVSFNPDQPENPERLKFTSDNAGATLRALGLYEDMRGGKIIVNGTGRNPEKPEEIYGTIGIDGFTIANAPFLAKLLSLLSVEGFFEGATSGDTDITFQRMLGKFYTEKNEADEWLVVFENAKVKSASLGLTFSGRTNIDAKTLNIKGEIIPAAGLNKAINNIPIIGKVISGGKDSALFAARYSIKGPDKDPEVRINPLSALTPGFLRNFLFGDESK